jgi:2-keto-4-pentenoate hydratase/2-oxohepta-3-ene-1,7-dioic acid hydratase in catechol pathway
VRIARFSVEDEPRYGVVESDSDDSTAGTVGVLDSDPLYRPVQFTGERLPLADVRLLAPVIPRSKVVCVGRNYAAHAAELGNELPTEPLIFLKPNTAVIGPNDGIVYPPQTQELHFEGELAIVIGRICRDLPPERANEVIFGYTVANDVTARDSTVRRSRTAGPRSSSSTSPRCWPTSPVSPPCCPATWCSPARPRVSARCGRATRCRSASKASEP